MQIILLPGKEISVNKKYDVAVAGGGIAGVSAALAAARNGAKVLLIEKECLLGGLATVGLITIYLPLCDGMGKQVSFGIAEELLRLSVKHFSEGPSPVEWLENGTVEERKKKRFQVQYNPHLFVLETEKLLLEAGVEILYDTKVLDTIVENSKIRYLVIDNKSGTGVVEVSSIVDATGDADICKYAKEQTAVFKPKNILANWYYFLSNGSLHLRQLSCVEIPNEDNSGIENLSLTNRRYSGLDGEEISAMLCDGHRKMFEDILKHRESDETYVPVTSPTIPQLRMTRKIVGRYVLDITDIHKSFETSIGSIGDWRRRGPVYQIPFEALYGSKIKNLITAGRCISVTDAMWDISRVIPACAVTGEAAGTAAALTSDFAELDVQSLQSLLVKNGTKL